MVQELRETSDALQNSDEKELEKILNANPKGRFWVVIAHKPIKQRLKSGEIVIKKVIKLYKVKPNALLGTIILEINDGQIVSHEISPLDAPIDYGRIEKHAGLVDYSSYIINPRASQAYIYN
jgi:hypothetical protein